MAARPYHRGLARPHEVGVLGVAVGHRLGVALDPGLGEDGEVGAHGGSSASGSAARARPRARGSGGRRRGARPHRPLPAAAATGARPSCAATASARASTRSRLPPRIFSDVCLRVARARGAPGEPGQLRSSPPCRRAWWPRRSPSPGRRGRPRPPAPRGRCGRRSSPRHAGKGARLHGQPVAALAFQDLARLVLAAHLRAPRPRAPRSPRRAFFGVAGLLAQEGDLVVDLDHSAVAPPGPSACRRSCSAGGRRAPGRTNGRR